MIKSSPKPHQVLGAKFLVKKKFGLLGFKTGKGKTLTSIACMHHHVSGKKDFAVVFAPVKAYDKVWKQEISKHTDMTCIRMPDLYATWKKRHNLAFVLEYDIVLVKYSEVQKFIDLLPFLTKDRITVYDECHKLKNPEANVTRLLAHATKHAKAKWGLTATAIGNSLMDIWGLMQFFGPTVFGTMEEFQRDFCNMSERVIGKWPTGKLKKIKEITGYKNLDDLNKIIDTFMFTVESDISVQFHELEYNITVGEEEVYLEAAQGVLEKDKKKKGFAQRLPDLQRATDGSRDIHGQPQDDYRSSKYKVYLAQLKELVLVKKESVLVYAEFIDTFAMLKHLLKQDLQGIPFYQISGTKIEDPHQFPCVTLISGGGSESLNLKFANHVMCYSVPFSVKQFVQMVGRITRMDSDFLSDLNVWLPMCDLTIDYYKNRYLKVNAALIDTVLGKEKNLPEQAVDDERKHQLGELRKNLLFRTQQLVKKK